MSDASPRTVVSMPSLDAVDEDMAASAETSDTTLSGGGLLTEVSFTSTMSTESVYSTNTDMATESFPSTTETFTTSTVSYAGSSEALPPEESFTTSETQSVDPNQLLETSESEQIAEEEQPKVTEVETHMISEEPEAILHQDESIDEQAEDDPSIAIDQFIKKIADEQLSSKRRGLDSELEHNEEQQEEPQKTTQEDLEATLTGEDVGDNQQNDSEQSTEPSSSMDVDNQDITQLNSSEQVADQEKSNDVVEPEQSMETEAMSGPQQSTELPQGQSPVRQVPSSPQKELLSDIILDSSEVSRDPFLIALAQEEIKKLDILVCGGCHLSFYMIEEFQEHKNGQCTDVSSVASFCESEGKPQVWGFALWRAKYLKDSPDSPPRPWIVYQKWCKLPQQEKNAWITAGQSVQYMSKIVSAKITSVKKRQTVEKDPLAIEFVDSNKENADIFENSTNIAKKTIVKPVKLNSDVTILPSSKTNIEPDSNKAVRTTKNLPAQRQEYAVERILAKRFNPRRKTWEYQIKWENFDNSSNTWEPISNLSHCKQMLEQFEEQLKRVKEEKAKQAALAGKGRGRPSKPSPVQILPKPEDSTPGRPQRSSKQKATNQIKSWVGNSSDEDENQGTKRPREDDDDYDDADYEVFEKKMKLEEMSDDSEDEEHTKATPMKKITSTPAKPTAQKTQPVNIKSSIVGQKGKQEILPANILIPDANGVVRINQKQLPALSSGVYIMSKTAGIIKLDSNTSKVATSGGQTIVKVAPKIGQTQIKIVKKYGNTTEQIVQVSPKSNVPLKPIASSVYRSIAPKTYPSNKTTTPKPKVQAKVVQRPKLTPQPRIEIKPPPTPPPEEESDDGIEPLEFPEEIIIPDPEPENPDFELDPETGKIKGLDYVDKPVIIKEEPSSRPPTTNELENIVKLAAADITDDDLTNGNASQHEQDPLDISHNNTYRRTPSSSSQGYKQFITKNPNQARKPEGSLLNKALTGGTSIQRNVSGGVTTPQHRMQPKIVTQRVINQQVGQRSASGGLTTRIVTQSRPVQQQQQSQQLVRKVITPRPKFSVASQQQRGATPGSTVTRIMPQQASGLHSQVRTANPSKVQVYSTKSQGTPQGGQQNMVRRVGYGINRSSTAPQIVQRVVQKQVSPQKPQARIVQRYYTSPTKKETPQIVNRQMPAQSRPKQVISMPSLIGEEEATPPTPKLAAKPQSLAQASRSPTKSFSEQPAPKPVVPVEEPQPEASSDNVTTADLSTFTMADSENPIYITGDDGTVYQVAGQNEQGQTILITQGPDGQQQCLLVTNEVSEGSAEETAAALQQVAENESAAVAADEEQVVAAISEDSMMIPLNSEPVMTEASHDVQAPLQIKTDIDIEETMLDDGSQDQVVAQVVRAEPPSPGGTHKVVVMLPDGNLMVTQVSPEEYASLELD